MATSQRAADFAARHFRWNAAVLVVEGTAFWCGWALFDNETVLPLLLSGLGASDRAIGALRMVQTLGFTLPALLAAHYIHGRVSHKRFLLAAAAAGRAGLLALPPLLYFGGASPRWILPGIFFTISVFWLIDGGCAVSWFDIIAKTVPARVRGRFFGAMQLGGGLASLAAAAVVSRVLRYSGLAFPRNFALLASGWCVMLVVSQVCLALIREPDGHAVEEKDRPTFREYLRQALPLLRRRPALRRLITGRVLLDSSGMALPFYILFAQRDLSVSMRVLGLYIFFKAAGRLCGGPIWGWTSDKLGPARALLGVAYCMVSVPALALVAGHGALWAMAPLFFLVGAVSDGLWMTTSNALLDAVDPAERPLAVGVSSLCQAPGALYGLLGGILAQQLSYAFVFWITLAVGLVGLRVVWGLQAVDNVRREVVVDA